jgi:tetratricopeptide (TPR) repeat protein
MPALAQAPTPAPQAILEQAAAAATRADEVAQLAKEAAQQTTQAINVMEKLAWFFGLILTVVAATVAFFGFDMRRGFEVTQNEYRAKLAQAEDALHQQQVRVQAIEQQMDERLQRLNAFDQEIDALREKFEARAQALVLINLGNQLYNSGKVSPAIDAYEQAQRLMPDDAETNYYLGRAYSNRERYQDAIAALTTAIAAMPSLPEAHMELGLAYRRQAELSPSKEEREVQYRLAEDHLKQAIRLRLDYDDALATMGGLCRRQRRISDAMEYYRKACLANTNTSYPLANLASLYWEQGDRDRACYYFQQADDVATRCIQAGGELIFWNYYDRALARLAHGKLEDARSDFKQAIAHTPGIDHYRSVLDNILFLRHAQPPMVGLDEFIAMLEPKMPDEMEIAARQAAER